MAASNTDYGRLLDDVEGAPIRLALRASSTAPPPAQAATSTARDSTGEGRWSMHAVRETASVARERLAQVQIVNELLANRTHVFFIAAFGGMHFVIILFGHFLWSTAHFQRPFVIIDASLAACGATAIVWFAWLAPRWFRRARPAADGTIAPEAPAEDRTWILAAAATDEQRYPVQCSLPARDSAEMAGVVGVSMLMTVLFMLVAFAVRYTRGLVGHGQLAWIGVLLPVLLGVDYVRHRWERFVAARTTGVLGPSAAAAYVPQFPESSAVDGAPDTAVAAAAATAAGGNVIHGPWLAGGNVAVGDWRVAGALISIECMALITCFTFEPLPSHSVALGAAFGFSLGIAAIGGAALVTFTHFVRSMRSSNVVCLVALFSALMLVPFTVALDRTRGAAAAGDAVHGFEHAGLLTLYLVAGGVVVYAYGVLGIGTVRRLGTVHTAVLVCVSLSVARVLGMALTGHLASVAWTGAVGCAALLALGGMYVYACVAARLRPAVSHEYVIIDRPSMGGAGDHRR